MRASKTITAADDYLEFRVAGRNADSGVQDGPGTFEIAVSGRTTSTLRVQTKITDTWVADSDIEGNGVFPGTVHATGNYRIGCPTGDYDGETIYVEVRQ
jgi:hypothetical protein